MILYEIRAFQTAAYDKRTEQRIRLRSGHGRDILDRWIADYLAQHPDGKVIVSTVGKSRKRQNLQTKKLFVQTANEKRYV